MTTMLWLRRYHTVLAVLVVIAFVTGDAGRVHALLGYAIAVIMVLRLLAVFTGLRQLGLSRFYPRFEGLRLDNAVTHPAISRTLLACIAATLLVVAATGIALDRGRTIGVADGSVIVSAHADDDRNRQRVHRRDGKDSGTIEELQEAAANAMMALVGLHVVYLLLFKRPLAWFMLFLDTPRRE
jgi:cytochrome b